MKVNSLEDMEVVRNTLQLLNEIRTTSQTISELRSDVCKEIFYSCKDVHK